MTTKEIAIKRSKEEIIKEFGHLEMEVYKNPGSSILRHYYIEYNRLCFSAVCSASEKIDDPTIKFFLENGYNFTMGKVEGGGYIYIQETIQ